MGYKDPEAKRAYHKAYTTKHKERLRDKALRYKFGITSEQYAAMLEAQGFRCAICGTEDPSAPRNGRFAVDHCHNTGAVRGLLCNNCNQGLGRFKDDPTRLLKAVEYLK